MERFTQKTDKRNVLRLQSDKGRWAVENRGQWALVTITGDAVDRLAHYEDLEEQGRLKEVPSMPIKTMVKTETPRGMNTQQKFACPRCLRVLFIQNHIDFSGGDGFTRFPQGNQTEYCHNCGQRLEWNTTAEAALTPTPASDEPEGE